MLVLHLACYVWGLSQGQWRPWSLARRHDCGLTASETSALCLQVPSPNPELDIWGFSLLLRPAHCHAQVTPPPTSWP